MAAGTSLCEFIPAHYISINYYPTLGDAYNLYGSLQ